MPEEQETQINGYGTEEPEADNGGTLLLAVGVIAAIGVAAWAVDWLFD